MRKQLPYLIVLLALAFSSHSLWAQEPPANLNGEALKQWLKTNWYDGKHTTLGYSDARLKMYQTIDNDNNSITCVYSGYEKSWSSTNSSTNPDPINCEHTVPQSFFGEAEPMRSDIHHLFPTYGSWNSERSNHPFSEINDDQTTKWMYQTSSSGSKPSSNIDAYSESTGSRFEPREDHKGNCARAIFYFYTMYASSVGDISTVGNLNTLYQWHLADPVDANEISRNDGVEDAQGNRNPYIDYPELIERAFVNFTVGPLAPTASIQSDETEITISWSNVANETGYRVYKSTDNVNFSLVNTAAADVLQYIDAAVVKNTNYYYYVIAFNADGNSTSSNMVSAALVSSGGGGANDLFFSEYVEGSSYDKAVEIANFTGQTIDLSAYSIMKQRNGTGQWESELQLSGSLNNGAVYVVCHYDANSAIKAKANLVEPTDSWTMSFNGNDPIGLFKNGTQIDALGNFNSSVEWGENVTLIRKPSINGPSTIFSLNDWDSKSSGTVSFLGLHTINNATDINDNSLLANVIVKVYPVPASEILTIELEEVLNFRMLTAQLLDLTGKIVYSTQMQLQGNVCKEQIDVSAFNQGLYFLIINLDDEIITKKVIIQ